MKRKKKPFDVPVAVVVISCVVLLCLAAYLGSAGRTETYRDAVPGTPVTVDPEDIRPRGAVDFAMDGVEPSDQNGDVQIGPEGGASRVDILLAGTKEGDTQKVEIRRGRCNELQDTLFELNAAVHRNQPWGIVVGESSTLLPVPQKQLLAAGIFSIVAHAPGTADEKIVSCGSFR